MGVEQPPAVLVLSDLFALARQWAVIEEISARKLTPVRIVSPEPAEVDQLVRPGTAVSRPYQSYRWPRPEPAAASEPERTVAVLWEAPATEMPVDQARDFTERVVSVIVDAPL